MYGGLSKGMVRQKCTSLHPTGTTRGIKNVYDAQLCMGEGRGTIGRGYEQKQTRFKSLKFS